MIAVAGFVISQLPGSRSAPAEGAFLATCTTLFVGSVAALILRCASVPALCLAPVPGGGVRSIAWMRMPGQTWFDAAASFMGMWSPMTVAMMLPSLVPMLRRYRQRVARWPGASVEGLTARVGLGYFLVWSALGMLLYPLGVGLAAAGMRQPVLAFLVPLAAGLAALLAGALQFSSRRNRHLACCRPASCCDPLLAADPSVAWRYGLQLGLHCCVCCIGPVAVQLAIGIMDLRAMAVVTVAIAFERWWPDGQRVTRLIGVLGIAAGVLLLARAGG